VKHPPPLPEARLSLAARQLRLGLLVGGLFLALFLFLMPHLFGKAHGRCSFLSVTGLPCAMCGGTRAVRALAAGDVERSLYLNAAAIPTLLGIGSVGLVLAFEAISGRRAFPGFRRSVIGKKPYLIGVVLVIVIVPWTVWHAWEALSTPKPELIMPDHPVVKVLRDWLLRD